MAKRILIVEDDALIAMSLAQDLEDAGFLITGPCLNVTQALHTLKTRDIDGAVLDMQLGQETSADVAIALKQADIPFVVVSGYAAEDLALSFQGAPVVSKPIRLPDLIAQLHAI